MAFYQNQLIAMATTLEILENEVKLYHLHPKRFHMVHETFLTSGSAIAEGPRDVLVSRNSATTKYRYRVALFA